MRFIKGSAEDAARYVAERIRILLASDKSVLWLVSGGSNVFIQTAAMEMIPDSLSKNLTIMPVDERYGPYNHRKSVSAQLRKAGFDPKHAEWVDILEDDIDIDGTVSYFNQLISREIAMSDYIFATLGMGSDGHTAGILPHSPALSCSDIAMHYKGPDFERITLCADALVAHCDEVVLSAFGKTKSNALHRLAEEEDQREVVPAILLRDIPNSVVFNDIIEGEQV